MLQIRIDVGSEIRFLDLFNNENVELEVSVNEIQDVTRKNSGFTKSFKVPGSKTNNDIFNYFFDVNSTGIDYDLSTKIPARIIYNGYDILIGHIRLDEVTIEDGEINYGITFYNQVGDLASNISDKTLRDIDYSSLSHDYTSQNIFNSQLKDPSFDYNNSSNPNVYENGKVFYPLMHYGYEYNENKEVNVENTPLLAFGNEYGYFDNVSTPLPYYYYKPAIQIKEMYELIVGQAGYSVSSNFFNTSYFKRFYLPLTFNSEDLYLSQSVKPYFEVLAEDPIPPYLNVTYNSTPVNILQLQQVLADVTGLSNAPGDLYSITANTTGQLKGLIRVQATNPDTCDPTYNPDVEYRIRIFEGNVIGTNLIGNYILNLPSVVIPCGGGTVITEFDILFNVIYTRKYYFLIEDSLGTNPAVIDGYRILINDGAPTVNNPIDLGLEVSDEYKQIDFITSINRLFNLVVVPNPEKEYDLIIEPVIDYYGTGEVLDWTTKVDRSKSITIRPTTMFSDGSLNYELKEDKDHANQEYKKLTNKTFGNEVIKLKSNYKDNEKKFDFIFSNIVDDVVTTPISPYMTIPVSNIQKQEENEGQVTNFYNPYRSLPRLIFRVGHIPKQNLGLETGIRNIFGSTVYEYPGIPLTNRVNTYPNKVQGLTHFINFNDEDRFNNLEEDFSGSDTLYDVYYKDFIEELNNPENRFVTLSVYLDPYEVKNLRWNERIIIDNTYYRLNRISKYNLTEPGIAQVELTKELRTFKKHPKACFSLTDCSTGEVEYVSTDDSYTLFLFNNRVLRRYVPPLIDYCVLVEQVDCNCVEEFNDNFKLDEYLFSSSEDIYRVYENCDDCLNNVNLIPTIEYYNSFNETLPCGEPVPPTTTTTTTLPVDEFYYRVEECQLPEGFYIIQTNQVLSVGQSVKISVDPEGCYEIVSVLPPTLPSATLLQVYTNCSECVTGTTTTTTTDPQTLCILYEICPPNLSGESIEIQYINCQGNTMFLTVYWNENCQTICARQNSIQIIQGQGSVYNMGITCN